MLTSLSIVAPLAERASPLFASDTLPAQHSAPGVSGSSALAMLSPETLILALASLLITGCVFIALEIRAEYRDN